jgi:predicted ATPase
MERYFAQMRGALERHGGTVEKFIGDAVMAVFGMPTIHEDDALRAVRAADDMRHELQALNGELTRDWDVQIDMRTGVNTGEVVVSGDDDASYVLGSPVNMAARLEQAAGPGEILLGPDTYRLVHSAVEAEAGEPLDLKGIDEPVIPMRLLAVHAGGSLPARGTRSPVVGRDEELELLTHLCRRAAANRRCQLITILGDAGVGKTRLADELVAALGHDVRVLHGRCLPYGEGITFYPVAEALSHAAGIDPGDDPGVGREKLATVLGPDEQDAVDAVAEAIGLGGSPASPEQTQWAIRRAFESLARERPLVLLFDDLQWAEPTFLDLVESMADRTREVPLILLCTARPELLELRSEWGGGKRNAVTTLLEPLAPDDIVTLATNLLGDGTLDAAAGDRIADASGGNPLFVEEYVSMLVEEGGLRRDGDRWVLPGSALRVSTPPSLAALLAAKLDRLPPDERAVLVYASVIGKVFSTGELEALLPSAHVLDLDGTLGRLRDRELIRPAHGAEPGGAPYEFLHLLVRDSAYESLPKATRADLHERFAAWLETSLGPRAEEYQEIVGYHLGQAHRYLRELGSQDPRLDELAAHAAERLGAAGRRAADRGDAPAARRLFERAIELAPDPAVRADDRLWLLGILQDLGDRPRLQATLRLAREDVVAAADGGLTARLGVVDAYQRLLSDPTSVTLDELQASFRDHGATLTSLGDGWNAASALSGEALVGGSRAMRPAC